jgi:hypothetical protein
MVTYVLGAGASFHKGYPLTVELGNRLHEWVRQNWSDENMEKSYIEALYTQYDGLTDLESVLTELSERPCNSRAAALTKWFCGQTLGAFRIAIPEFFNSIREVPNQNFDAYEALCRRAVHPGDVVITFNYDLACERALRTAGLWEIGDGYGFTIADRMTPPAKVKVLKLHGSTNWLRILFGGIKGFSQASNVYGPRPVVFRDADYIYLGYANDVRDPLRNGISITGGVPALILPTLHKDFFHQTSFGREWESFWSYLWTQAAHALHSSDRIVIIGYSVPAADENARELLLKRSNPDAEILVYSGSRSGIICEEFRKRGFQNVRSSETGRFEDFQRD